jgi:hypothetical protein
VTRFSLATVDISPKGTLAETAHERSGSLFAFFALFAV